MIHSHSEGKEMKKFAQFHDGFMDGVLIEGTKATVFLSTEQRETFALNLEGVLSVKIDDFKEGNIIYDVVVREGDELTRRDIVQLYGFTEEAKAELKLQKVKLDGLVVMEISPSYGASCLILAGSVALINRQEWKDRLFAHSS
jgi:hypothetical protein